MSTKLPITAVRTLRSASGASGARTSSMEEAKHLAAGSFDATCIQHDSCYAIRAALIFCPPPSCPRAGWGRGRGALRPVAEAAPRASPGRSRSSARRRPAPCSGSRPPRAMASKEGYALSKEGLSDMLKDQQRGFLQAYDGCEGLCKALGSDSAAGLGGDAGDLASRRETYGANYIEPPAMKTYWELILEGCEDNTVQALIICATVSLTMIVAEKPSHRFVASIEGVAI